MRAGMEEQTVLTKSLYTTGLDNVREMWYESRDRITPGAGARWRMKQGQEVGQVARRHLRSSEAVITVSPSTITLEDIQEVGEFVGGAPTSDQLQSDKLLFEVEFSTNGMSARIDILRPTYGGWKITEVKSGTMSEKSDRKEAKQDLAFQVFVLEEKGYDVSYAEVAYVNSDYVHPDKGDLFETMALTEEGLLDEVRTKAPEFKEILQKPCPPDLPLSRVCKNCKCPEPCRALPEQSIFTLPGLYWGHMDDILDEGRATLDEVEGHERLKDRHTEYIHAVRADEIFIEPDPIRDHLSTIKYPIHYLDFEAIGYAIPEFEGTSPWQKVPFQYSLHVQDRGDAAEDVKHAEYLHDDTDDPRRDLVENLIRDVGDQGSVVVYHKTFEKGILEDLCDDFPQYEDELENIIERLWDQAKIFKNWHFIHPDQKGSWSLKSVLPIFAPDLDYGDLDVQNGMEAVIHYDEMVNEASPVAQEEIYQNLLDYCERDTFAMVRIHQEIKDLVS
jgi:CRISPR/Cas system-associated exonuclease Cas4 (RecB family)